MVVTDQFIFSYSRPVFVSMTRIAKHIKRVLIWKVWTSCEVYLAAAWCARLYFCRLRSLSCHSASTVALTRFVIAASCLTVFIIALNSCEWRAVCDPCSCKDGVFRKYQGARTKDDFLAFVQDQKWKSIEPVSSWFGPSSFLWVSLFLVLLQRVF